MRVIMVMFDSLNRNMLNPYGGNLAATPNFNRLAEHSVTFDNCYAGSLPCMPARRELHTGRYNFLHRSWGPLEPFDDSMPELLNHSGIHSHMVTDHYHYFEDGGATYHTRYRTWEGFRGQEGDAWKGVVSPDQIPEGYRNRCDGVADNWEHNWVPQDFVNRSYMETEEKQPQSLTFEAGCSFIRTNHGADQWYLQIETFDPHEPFFSQEKFKKLFPDPYNGGVYDWPDYRKVDERDTPEEILHLRAEYAALLTMCDEKLGEVLDLLDEYGMWKDTMVIVNTDHGFLLAEHGQWAKCHCPFYNEVARIPLFIWDPRCGVKGEHRMALSQNIDLAPTILQYFGVPISEDMRGKPLKNTIESDVPVRKYGIFGIHGGPVNITDGRYVYMRAVRTPEARVWEYTLMPAHMKNMFAAEELRETELEPPLAFTKGCPVMKIPVKTGYGRKLAHDVLFDLRNDPGQERPMHDEEKERELENALTALFLENDAPDYVYRRFGLDYIPGKREEAVHETDL